ncbi:CRAL/TRIO domain-containing protein [Neocallimastix lanati (nom. inval.)]|jgi:hypothetical protein|uniref:CRAL/TRIO domain-containing protein n=1 Tax=Neocallimastix californiae TaxID=1754190 RepID=A0A1Y2B1J1_9FUNG|nr:CRAL/TRIO domain-containing protein [Neocallimastix sp. JGI-2020a]ORY28347.1 CRAL/TRIO domain-containing protein [Neocallimastix californiae]|eukprot:ORY28347.1 CRAL/TRIO domain-containing protein [Neocallimastix californiae]
MEYKVSSGRYGNLTEEQEQILKDLILKVKKEGLFCEERHDIHYFLRFLRARNFDLEKTYLMFSNCEKWRKVNKIDELYETFTFPELGEVEKIYPKYYHNVDLQGRPIYVEQFSNFNIKKLFEHTSEDRLLNYFIIDYEIGLRRRFPSCSNAAGHHVETGLTIMDLKDVSLLQFSKCFNFLKKTSKIASDYYPECMGNLFVINAPKAFAMCWKLIKGILDPVTAEKIQILDKKYEKVLLKYASPEALPKIYGGKCNCAKGCSHSNVGPWNDPEFDKKETYEITIDEFLKKFETTETTSDIDSEFTLSEFNKLEMNKNPISSDNTIANPLPSPPQSPSSPITN